jgi:dCMP deaminase
MSIEQKDSVWLEACEVLAKGFSKCSRQQFVAIIVDDDNQVVSIGYNGNVRGQEGDLCGGSECLRDTQHIESGQHTDIGCIHAEENAILNCARQGISCKGGTIYINAEPCPKCASRIVQSGLRRVVCKSYGYPDNGIDFLRKHGLEIRIVQNMNA